MWITWVCVPLTRVVASQGHPGADSTATGAAASAAVAPKPKPSVPPLRAPPSTAALWLNSQGKRLRSIAPEMHKELALCVPNKHVPAHRWVRSAWCPCSLCCAP